MTKPIVLHLKEKLKNLNALLTISRLWGPLATIAFTVAYHAAAIYFGLPISLVFVTCFVVLGTFMSGLRGGAVAALWAIAYALYTLPFDRAVQILIGLPIIVLIVGWQTRLLREFYKNADELLNGNATRLNQALSELRTAREKLVEARKLIDLSEDKFGNVLARVVGYKGLKDTIKAVNEFYDNPENVKRLRDMDKAQDDQA